MKGLYVINTHIENKRAHMFQIFNTVAALNDYMSVDVVAPAFSDCTVTTEDIANMYGVSGKVRIKLLNTFFRNVSIWSFIFFNVHTIIYLVKSFFKKNVDFIYTRSDFFLPTILVAKLLRIPCFFEIHRRPKSRSEYARFYLVCKLSCALITISSVLRDMYLPLNKHILVAHDGVDIDIFNTLMSKSVLRKRKGLGDEVVAIYTGHVSRIKGVDLIYEIAPRFPHVTFMVIGPRDDVYFNKLPSSNIILIDRVPHKDIIEYLTCADIALLPHPNNGLSQSPMKLFEYMAAGLPIISADLPNLREVLPSNGNLFFTPEDSTDFYRKLREYIDHKSEIEVNTQHNLKEIRKYTWCARGKKIAMYIKQYL